MRNIIKAVIVLGSIATAITGTTVAVKKNKKAAAWYEKFMPAFVKTSAKTVETKSVFVYKQTKTQAIKQFFFAKAEVDARLSTEMKDARKALKQTRENIVNRRINEFLSKK